MNGSAYSSDLDKTTCDYRCSLDISRRRAYSLRMICKPFIAPYVMLSLGQRSQHFGCCLARNQTRNQMPLLGAQSTVPHFRLCFEKLVEIATIAHREILKNVIVSKRLETVALVFLSLCMWFGHWRGPSSYKSIIASKSSSFVLSSIYIIEPEWTSNWHLYQPAKLRAPHPSFRLSICAWKSWTLL